MKKETCPFCSLEVGKDGHCQTGCPGEHNPTERDKQLKFLEKR